MLGKKGFTMVEMLFVLSIMIVLSVFTLHFSISNRPKIAIEQQCSQIISLLEEAKTLALTSHNQVDINISSNQISYSQGNKSRTLLLNFSYYFKYYYDFHFNKNGNISSGGRIELGNTNEIKTIILNVGSGAFYVR
ncbi:MULTISPECIES: competence type IV pilus minor pilin ComGD [unclassified Thomasclavelia]|uniref:competence type IV pilus minor pilin ComGD n=1 Tax=unclassified Thomasclavelia TaxID=3025756 RepID=UPI000B3A5400|nr:MULTISPECIES: competence type IV pilus minor pilin ComGD [unclassified Thomasclavelia]OUQ09327.1 prepilin-type cleavage/methylation domain-containing protein [Erysipelatoclostridium sp. An15]